MPDPSTEQPNSANPEPIAALPEKLDAKGHKIGKRALNGGKREGAGCPKGVEKVSKRTYNPDKLAESLADSMVEKQSALGIKPAGPLNITQHDAKMLKRVTGLSVEEFNAKLSDHLAQIAQKVAQKIEEKLDADEFKTSELGFLFSVMHDKRMSMDGRAATQNAGVNVQINNYGSTMSKDELIDFLHGKPKNVTP